MKFNQYRVAAVLLLAVSVLFSTVALAENAICNGVPPTNCKEIKKTVGGTEVTCTECDIVACRDNGSGPIAGPGKQTSCPAEPTGFTPIFDDDSSYDDTTEMAPDVGGSGQPDDDTIVAPSNFTSALVVMPAPACGEAGTRTCDSHGASCDVIHDRGGNSNEVCRWSSRNGESACKRTSGIWTSTNSKYARNHPDAVKSGNKGACITDVKNLLGKKAPRRNDRRTSGNSTDHRKEKERTEQKIPGLATPTDLSVIDVSSTALTLVWTDNSDREFGVELYRIDPVAARNGQGADWEFIGLFEERIDSNVKGTGPRADEDFDLVPDTRYCYRMRAYMGFDRTRLSGYSEVVCAKTRATRDTQNDS